MTYCFLFSSGEDALPNGLDVTFEVTELRRMTGSYNTMVGNNEGSMVSLKMSPSAYYLIGNILLSVNHTALVILSVKISNVYFSFSL